MKMLPKQARYDQFGAFKEKRRIFNATLEKIAGKMNKFKTLNVDCILPTDDTMFSINTRVLSPRGFTEMWKQLDRLKMMYVVLN